MCDRCRGCKAVVVLHTSRAAFPVAGSKDSYDSPQRSKVEYGALMRYVVPA
jgi:hypothetical protein